MKSGIPFVLPESIDDAWMQKKGVKEVTVETSGLNVGARVAFADGSVAVYSGPDGMKLHLADVTWPDGSTTSFSDDMLSSMVQSGASIALKAPDGGAVGGVEHEFTTPELNQARASRLGARIPGVQRMVSLPCACERFGDRSVWMAVQHLNDGHHPGNDNNGGDIWTRERIADWLETLDIDLTVQPEPDVRLRGPHESALKSCLCPDCTPSASTKMHEVTVALNNMYVSAEHLKQQLGFMGTLIKEQQQAASDLVLHGSAFVGPYKGLTAEFVAEDELPTETWLNWEKKAVLEFSLDKINPDIIKTLLGGEPQGQEKEES